jgi:hypothetical protein
MRTNFAAGPQTDAVAVHLLVTQVWALSRKFLLGHLQWVLQGLQAMLLPLVLGIRSLDSIEGGCVRFHTSVVLV